MDGDIDYSRYSRAELPEALTRIDRSRFPRNYENLQRALDSRATEPQGDSAPPSTPFLVVCYTAAVLVLNALLNLVVSAALFVIYHDSADYVDTAAHIENTIFVLLVVGAYFHAALNFQRKFAKVALGVALTLSVFNLLAARLASFRGALSPVAAFLGMLALALLAAGVARLLAAASRSWRVSEGRDK